LLRLTRRQCTDQINLLERWKHGIEHALAGPRREFEPPPEMNSAAASARRLNKRPVRHVLHIMILRASAFARACDVVMM
jgi:hypothetical protein